MLCIHSIGWFSGCLNVHLFLCGGHRLPLMLIFWWTVLSPYLFSSSLKTQFTERRRLASTSSFYTKSTIWRRAASGPFSLSGSLNIHESEFPMKIQAAIAHQINAPLTIEELDLAEP
ncbi:hypothetical protein ACKLNO_11910 [Neisseriaceae bacterium B1]